MRGCLRALPMCPVHPHHGQGAPANIYSALKAQGGSQSICCSPKPAPLSNPSGDLGVGRNQAGDACGLGGLKEGQALVCILKNQVYFGLLGGSSPLWGSRHLPTFLVRSQDAPEKKDPTFQTRQGALLSRRALARATDGCEGPHLCSVAARQRESCGRIWPPGWQGIEVGKPLEMPGEV